MSNGTPSPPAGTGAPAPPPERNVLVELGNNSDVTVSPRETPEEAAHRRAKEMKELEHRQRIEWWRFAGSFGVGLTLFAGLAIFSAVVLFTTADPTVRQVVAGLLTTILGAIVGFVAGQGAAKKG